MEKKYKLTEETIIVDGRTLHRIEALKDFANVKKGEKGGFIENENNLTQYGKCWVYDNAEVSGYAMVHNNATVSGNAKVSGNAMIHEDAKVYGNAEIVGMRKQKAPQTTQYSRIGGAAEDISLGQGATICGRWDASIVQESN